MVTAGMRRYRVRNDHQATLVGELWPTPIDADALFADSAAAGGPIRLEIGCGHGEFIAAMAAHHPHERFLGIEHDNIRVTKCAHKCLKSGATNVRLFSDEAHRCVRFRIAPASLSRIYILFPDPWPKAGHRRRRLLTRAFLLDLAHAAAPGCRFIMASDAHEYAFQCLSNTTTLPGLWRSRLPGGYAIDRPTRFPTLFEQHKKSEGHRIVYLELERTRMPAPERTPWVRLAGPTAGNDADEA
jgi:tRNA (guanine-N7-)-methyltransferase